MEKDSLDVVLKKDARYQREAYNFTFEALEFTMKRIKEKRSDAHPESFRESAPYPKVSEGDSLRRASGRHVSGQELLDGIREYALEQFGPLARMVFNKWGVHKTDDFGEIVFNLVNAGLMGKTEQDSKEDFKDRYSFEEVFKLPDSINSKRI